MITLESPKFAFASPRRATAVGHARSVASHRRVLMRAAAGAPPPEPLAALLEPVMPLLAPLAYVKAASDVAAQRATQAFLDVAVAAQSAIAESPQRLADFDAEVRALADRELQQLGQPGLLLPASTSASNSGTSGSTGAAGGGGGGASAGPQDLATVVDELRADIAASRALLQQLRSGTPLPPPST